MKKWIFLSAIALFILSSCSIQKRNYQAGYYISWKKNSSATHKAHETSKLPEIAIKEPILPAELTASSLTHKENTEQSPAPVYTGTKTYIDNCDTLFFRNGMVVKAKVTEIGISEVKYRYCNNPEGPLLIAKKDDIASVTYANGDHDVFTIAPKTRTETGWKKQDEVARARGMASDCLMLGIFSLPGLLFYLVGGLICAGLAINKGRSALWVLSKNPDENYRSIQKARTGILLAKITFGIVIFLALLLLLVYFHMI